MTTQSVGHRYPDAPSHREPPGQPPAGTPIAEALPVARRGSWGGKIVAILVVLAIGGGAYWWFAYGRGGEAPAAGGGKGGAGGNRVVPIVATKTTSGDLPIYLTGLGTVTGLNTVTVRARVDGELTAVAFEEGQYVQAGQFLAQIDPRPFDVQIQQAQGQLAKDQAALDNAMKDRDRYKEAGDAISKQQVDTAEASVKQFAGAVATDKGQLGNAELQKVYSRIIAPIPGRIGLRLVDQGNMVHATDTTGLAVITQVRPIAVLFTLPQDDIPRLTKRMREVEAAKDPTQFVAVDAYDRDGNTKLATGKVLAVDNQVDMNSGTIRVKAVFDNADQSLYPNQFVNARLLVETRHNATLVSPAALQRGPDSTFVYVVKEDETVEVRPVKVGPTEAGRTVVESGLSPGETVATDGVDKLRAGAKVKASFGGGGGAGGPGGRQGKGQAGGAASRPATDRSAADHPSTDHAAAEHDGSDRAGGKGPGRAGGRRNGGGNGGGGANGGGGQ